MFHAISRHGVIRVCPFPEKKRAEEGEGERRRRRKEKGSTTAHGRTAWAPRRRRERGRLWESDCDAGTHRLIFSLPVARFSAAVD